MTRAVRIVIAKVFMGLCPGLGLGLGLGLGPRLGLVPGMTVCGAAELVDPYRRLGVKR